MRILIVEDEERLARSIRAAMQTLPSFVADLSHDGEDGLHMALNNAYDAIILDLMLPKTDGLEVLRRLRQEGRATPVLILTARSAKEDIIRGLDFGSDDYLGKPFDMGELIARIKSLIRRSHMRPDPVLRVGDLEIDTRSHIVRRGGRGVPLRAIEYRLLEYLAFRAGAVVPKSEILEHLYDYNWERFSNVIEHHVSVIRSKMEATGGRRIIHTLRGQGYMLDARGSAE